MIVEIMFILQLFVIQLKFIFCVLLNGKQHLHLFYLVFYHNHPNVHYLNYFSFVMHQIY